MVFAMRTRARAGVRAVPVAARAAAPLRRGPAPARADVGGWAGEESTKEIFDDLENPTEDEFEAARKKMREESKKRLAEAAAEQAAKADFKASDNPDLGAWGGEESTKEIFNE